MTGATAPALVFDRIDFNRRRTRVLLAVFALMAGPSVLAVGGVIFLPLMALVGTILLLYVLSINPYPSESALLLWALVAVLLSILFSVVAIVAASRQTGARLVLKMARAKRVSRDEYPTLVNVVEELSIAAGLPTPALALIETPVPNAFAVGREPTAATIAVTRGLLEIVDRRQLAGVIGHELAHIGNQDTRLSGVVAVMTAVLAWPILWPFGLTRSSVGLVRQAGRLMLLGVALVAAVSLLACAWSATWQLDPDVAAMNWRMPVWWRLFVLFPVVAPVYGLLVAPVAAFLLRSGVSVEREFLADAQAALITRDPGGLVLALRALRDRSGDIPWAASASHLFIADPFGRRPPMWQRWFPTHPALDSRVTRLVEMFPSVVAETASVAGTPVAGVPPGAPHAPTPSMVLTDTGLQPAEQATAPRHSLRRTTQAKGRAVSSRDLPATTLLRVLVFTPLGLMVCLSPVGFFIGFALLVYGVWPLFSIIGERRLVGTCPSCGALVDTASAGIRHPVVCSSCHRTVFIEGDTFVEGDVSNVRDDRPAKAPVLSPPPTSGELAARGDVGSGVPVYHDPDGWSALVTTVPVNASVRVLNVTGGGNFVQVQVGHTIGFVSRSAPLAFEYDGAPGQSS